MTDAELLEQVQILEDGLVRYATGEGFGEANYEDLRRLVITNPHSKNAAPEFVKANRSLPQFWNFIKGRFAHYKERREFIWGEFGPLHDQLEGKGRVPADDQVSDVLSRFDVENVHAVWQTALERRKDDPEGAITSARTLLEEYASTFSTKQGCRTKMMLTFLSCIRPPQPNSILHPVNTPRLFSSKSWAVAPQWSRA